MGQHLSPRYVQVILVSGYPVLTTLMSNGSRELRNGAELKNAKNRKKIAKIILYYSRVLLLHMLTNPWGQKISVRFT